MADQVAGVEVTGAPVDRSDEVLTPEALAFLAELHRRFESRRRELLSRARSARRVERIADEEITRLGGEPGAYDEARALFIEVAVADEFVDFLTLPAYERMP
jgi:malate synthase